MQHNMWIEGDASIASAVDNNATAPFLGPKVACLGMRGGMERETAAPGFATPVDPVCWRLLLLIRRSCGQHLLEVIDHTCSAPGERRRLTERRLLARLRRKGLVFRLWQGTDSTATVLRVRRAERCLDIRFVDGAAPRAAVVRPACQRGEQGHQG